MIILSLDPEIVDYLEKRELKNKFDRQAVLFKENSFHPSLHVELLEPKRMKIWSFRIDRKYRAIFIFRNKNAVEIIDVNNHYQ